MNTDIIRKKKIAQLKIAQQQLQLDDDIYRDLLERITKKRSATQLSIDELNRAIDEMVRLGFVIKSQHGKRPKPRLSLEAMISKIEAILAEQKLPWSYAHAIARNKFGIDQVHWLSVEQCHSVVASLQIYANRQHKKERP